MTNRARPRRRLLPSADASGDAQRPATGWEPNPVRVMDACSGESAALFPREAGEVIVSPADLEARPWWPCGVRDGPRLAASQVSRRHRIPVIADLRRQRRSTGAGHPGPGPLTGGGVALCARGTAVAGGRPRTLARRSPGPGEAGSSPGP